MIIRTGDIFGHNELRYFVVEFDNELDMYRVVFFNPLINYKGVGLASYDLLNKCKHLTR